MTKSPRQRISILLHIHGGKCFIVAACDDYKAFEEEARKMESEGLVTVTEDRTEYPGIYIQRV